MALTQQILLEIVSASLGGDQGPTLDVVGGGGDDTCQQTRFVLLHYHAVLAHLLLYEDDLLGAPHHKVTAGVVRTLVEAGQLRLGLAMEDTVGGPQHHRHPTDGKSVPDDSLLASGVLNVHGDGGRVGEISEPAVMRSGALHLQQSPVRNQLLLLLRRNLVISLLNVRCSHPNIQILQVKQGI